VSPEATTPARDQAPASARGQAEEPPVLTDELIRAVDQALDDGDLAQAVALAAPLHAADQADLLEQLHGEDRASLMAELQPQLDPEVLVHLDETVRDELIEQLGPEETSAAIAQLETDDAIDILEDLDEAERRAILQALPLPDRTVLAQGLTYPEDSAGRLMQRELVAAPEFWTVGQTIDYLRAHPDLPDDFYDIYIVDPKFSPVGSIPLSKVLRSKRGVLLTELKLKELHLISFDQDQEDVAFRFRQYDLVSAPVVDAHGRLLGVITVDDIVHVMEEEAEEDILGLGGVQESDVFASPLQTGLRRFPWLLVNLGTAILASIVIAQFDASISQVVALAVLMPIVASMGGNAGTQTLTVVVRALAVKEVTPANAMRVLGKELIAGSLNGLLFMVTGVLVAFVWYGNLQLGILFGVAMLVTVAAGALAGVAIPVTMERLGLDPAVVSTVFLTTITDVVGFFTFLGLAALYLT
jgi:magnesium transporter